MRDRSSPCSSQGRLWVPAFAGTTEVIPVDPMRLERGSAAPGEKAVVLEAGLAVRERGAVQCFDPAAGGFEDRLASRSIPFHRRAEARVEVGLARCDDAEFESTAATLAVPHR